GIGTAWANAVRLALARRRRSSSAAASCGATSARDTAGTLRSERGQLLVGQLVSAVAHFERVLGVAAQRDALAVALREPLRQELEAGVDAQLGSLDMFAVEHRPILARAVVLAAVVRDAQALLGDRVGALLPGLLEPRRQRLVLDQPG